MRDLPPHADRYWELKKRRTRLRKSADPAWLADLGYGVHYEPVFADIPPDWRSRFRLAREFVDRWFGYDPGDVFATRKKPFVPPPPDPARPNPFNPEQKPPAIPDDPYPPAVIEWVSFINDVQKRPLITHSEADHRVRPMTGIGRALLSLQCGRQGFFVENEHWATADPPVRSWNYAEFGVGLPSLSGLVIQYLLWEVVGELDEVENAGIVSFRSVPKRLPKALAAACPVHTRFDAVEIFEARDLIAIYGPNPFSSEDEPRLRVVVRKTLTRDDLPACLRQSFRTHKPFVWGIFS